MGVMTCLSKHTDAVKIVFSKIAPLHWCLIAISFPIINNCHPTNQRNELPPFRGNSFQKQIEMNYQYLLPYSFGYPN